MANITINDLDGNIELGKSALADIAGGWYFLYQPAYYNPFYYNPFVSTLQSSWASRGMSFDNQHNSFIDFLRS